MNETALWTRLGAPGHDACQLVRTGDGGLLSGSAVFAHESLPTCLHYSVLCDSGWRTIEGRVSGWSGPHAVTARITRAANGLWTMNGHSNDSLTDCRDLDFGFTPATNVLQLRRLALQIGERADVPVAWFDLRGELQRLPQTYERLSTNKYRYEAPTVGYKGELEVNAHGFVRSYPGLWQEVE